MEARIIIHLSHGVVDYSAVLNAHEFDTLKRAIDNREKICIIDKNQCEHELSPAIGEIVTVSSKGKRVVLVKPVGAVSLSETPELVVKKRGNKQ